MRSVCLRASACPVCVLCVPAPPGVFEPVPGMNKVGKAVCGLRFDNSERIIADLGPTFRDLSFGTLA